MGFSSLFGFARELGIEDYTDRILSRYYEPARLLAKTQGREKAVLFNVEGSVTTSIGNLVDTRKKLWRVLGVSTDEEAYNKIIESKKFINSIKREAWPDHFKESERGWLSLPAIKFYEKDGGFYLTSGIVAACYNGVCNASIHRIMVVDDKEARIRIVPRHLWTLYRQAVENGEDLPVTIVFGVHPAYLVAAASSMAFGEYELAAGAYLAGDRSLVESPLHGNLVPGGAAIIVEAVVTREMADEGPFADILLLYDKIRKQPIIKPLKIYINNDEPIHVILSGGLEHLNLMGFPREASIWETVRKVVPRVKSVRLTPGGGGWLHAIVSIEKSHPADGKNAILAAFTGHPSLKQVIIVDTDINIDDPRDVEWAVATRFQAWRDLVLINNTRGSTLDPSSERGIGSKLGIDATIKGDPSRFRKARIP